MADALIFGDTIRSQELRHEVPIMIPDPFLYLERGGVRHVIGSSLEAPRLTDAGELVFHPFEEFGLDELRRTTPRSEILDEIAVRAALALGVESAIVPASFPLRTADRLRSAGVELVADQTAFDDRRRVKSAAELAGIRRAQAAAEAGMGAARDLLRRAEPNGDGVLELDGAPLTSERIKAAISAAFTEGGATAEDFVVSHGAQAAIGHHLGSGPIRAGETVVIDLWPRDNESACSADMSRTFVVGEVSDEIAEWHSLCKAALDRACAEGRAGVTGGSLHDGACEIFEAAGYPTQRTKADGTTLEEGFFHALGHGVGLAVHEEPYVGVHSKDVLVAGDVITFEPGLYRQGVGGIRLEDLLLVTEDGLENLTSFPYELAP